ncbi:MAG: hypothetical protein K2X71_02130 [Methylobacterium sp.]|nr:hypothetical protein [Methylobacterium sp.]
MAEPSPDPLSDLAARIVTLLPGDGTPVLNRVMRVMLARELERPVPPEAYFAARDCLFAARRIGRLRGQGGRIFLMPAEGAQPPAPARRAEAALMPVLRAYLEGGFRKGLDLPPDGLCLVEDTSTKGPLKGQWARPDFVLVSAMRFRLLPGAQVDVHGFELKTESGGSVQAVHEALAQTRFTHFGHLVWHLPEGARAEARLAEVRDQCTDHGIGLIRLRDPGDPEACEILLDPVRKTTPPAVIDGFLESRLGPESRARLERMVAETRA